jgi:hypothetical protein
MGSTVRFGVKGAAVLFPAERKKKQKRATFL